MIREITFLTAALVLSGHAVAINKCTGPDGKVSYQEASCPASAKANQEVKIRDNSVGSSQGSWKFERKNDELTGKVSCLAMSGITTPRTPLPNKFVPVHMVVAITSSSELIGVRTSDNSNSFHNDLSGMGVKTDNGPFVPITVKAGSHVVGFNGDASLIEALSSSKNLTIRARFWPYEQLYDMAPISSSGFDAALAQARSCATR